MKIIFIRHGDPCYNSYSLTEKGKKEVELLGQMLLKNEISSLYSGSSVRAKETSDILKKIWEKKVSYKQWLNEFKHRITADGKDDLYPWEMDLDLWCNNKEMLDYSSCLSSPIYASGNIESFATDIHRNIDLLLEEKGYKRKGNYYEVTNANKDCIVFVSHFATISVILSHLLNIPLVVMLHSFWMGPSSYTTLVSEEQNKGKAIFRCIGYNNISHLSEREELISYYGLQQEIAQDKNNSER